MIVVFSRRVIPWSPPTQQLAYVASIQERGCFAGRSILDCGGFCINPLGQRRTWTNLSNPLLKQVNGSREIYLNIVRIDFVSLPASNGFPKWITQSLPFYLFMSSLQPIGHRTCYFRGALLLSSIYLLERAPLPLSQFPGPKRRAFIPGGSSRPLHT